MCLENRSDHAERHAVRISQIEKAAIATFMRSRCSDTMTTLRVGTISTRGMVARGAGFVTDTWQGIRYVRNAKNRGDTFSQHSCIISRLFRTAAHITKRT